MSIIRVDWYKLLVVGLGTIFYGGLAIAISYPFLNSWFADCKKETITAGVVERENPVAPKGQVQIAQGTNGTQVICKKLDGTHKSTDVIVKPVDSVRTVGTYVEPKPYIPTYEVSEDYYCPITTCNDGTCSSSTGRGTCSWHGGVAY